jgi:hypothetical protein
MNDIHEPVQPAPQKKRRLAEETGVAKNGSALSRAVWRAAASGAQLQALQRPVLH